MRLTTTSLGGGDKSDVWVFPSTCGDDGDETETERRGPKPTSNRVTSTSAGCARAYESDKDGEGGGACKDVYFEFGMLGAVVFEDRGGEWIEAAVGFSKPIGVREDCKEHGSIS